MKSFIDEIAGYLVENYKDRFEQIAVVFPSRRAGLYLRKSMGECIDKPIIMPRVLSIEDFVYQVSGYTSIETVYLQFELYQIYRQQAGAKSQSFADFIHWGEAVLKEFNELDLALADPKQLFSYLNETKALTLWNLDHAPLTPFQHNYLQFYNSLGSLYASLRNHLIDKRKPYQGLAYRLLAEQWEREGVRMPWDNVLLAGFSALTKAEEKIFKQLELEKKGLFFWDFDAYYTDDPMQEAGHFIRHNQKVFKEFPKSETNNHFKQIPKNIEIIGVPQRIGQARLAGGILKKLSKEINLSTNSAIILNDEALILPLLNSLPEDIGKFNVTMGLPLDQTPITRLLRKVIDLQENAIKIRRNPSDPLRFYYKDILTILENPHFQQLLNESDIQLTQPIDEIRTSNKIFIGEGALFTTRPSDLFSQKGAHLSLLFSDWQNQPSKAIVALKNLVSKLKQLFISDTDKKADHRLNLEYLFHISKVLNTLESMVREYDFIVDLKTFKLIFNQVIKTLRLPFYGEPLQGVQVMGMLETRTLDFENLILLSVNEGHLPKGKTGNSFIPVEIKKEFGIPVYEEHNAVVAYHFYRLLQRAHRVYLLYNTEPDDLGGGDKSRFIMQLLHELPKKTPESRISERIVNLSADMDVKSEPIVVIKDEQVYKRLKMLAERGLSASSLNTFRRCSLKFYLHYVEGIREKDEPEETIEASTLGTVIHDVLNALYKPYIGLEISEGSIKNMKKVALKLIRRSFEENYPGGDIDHGKNLLIANVAEMYIQNFLSHELKLLNNSKTQNRSLRIIGLEKVHEFYFPKNFGTDSITVKLKGIFDRIDNFNGSIRIIDYKTGRVVPADLKFKEWKLLLERPTLDKSFQVLFYKYLYNQSNNGRFEPASGIISLRNLSSGFMAVQEPTIVDDSASFNSFEAVLDQLLTDIFDPQKPFDQTNDPKHCTYCAFKALCNRG